jgi:hypothetical protein
MKRLLGGIWPKSLQGQLLLAVAVALLLAQGISAVLLYRAQVERREAALVHAAAIRLFAANREGRMNGRHPPGALETARQLRVEQSDKSPLQPNDRRLDRAEQELKEVLAGQDFTTASVVVFHRPMGHDPQLAKRMARRTAALGDHAPPAPRELMVAAVEMPGNGGWMIVRMPVPRPERGLVMTLIGQTLLLYALLFGAIALILRRITRPLKALTGRLERFTQTRDAGGQLEPEGPDDVRRLMRWRRAWPRCSTKKT